MAGLDATLRRPRLAAAAAKALAAVGALRPRAGFRILVLHEVPEERLSALALLLDEVARRGGFLAPAEAEAMLDGRRNLTPARQPPTLVTFDDGFASDRRVADELLGPRGIAAIFFVCPGIVGLPEAERRREATQSVLLGRRPAPPLLGWDDVKALHAEGHTIGSHTMHHRRLADLRSTELERDIDSAAEAIRGQTGSAVSWAAFPFGYAASVSTPALATIARHHRYCCSAVRGFNDVGCDPLALLRQSVDLEAPLGYQLFALRGGLDRRHRRERRELDGLARSVRMDVVAAGLPAPAIT